MLVFALATIISLIVWGLLFIYMLFEHFFQILKELNNWYSNLILSIILAVISAFNFWGVFAGNGQDGIFVVSMALFMANICSSIFFYIDARQKKTESAYTKEKELLENSSVGPDGEIVPNDETDLGQNNVIHQELPTLEELLN